VLFARDAIEQGDPGSSAAAPFALLMLTLFAVLCGWVRVRDEIGAWFTQQMETTSGET
jgi:hypothetical protein